jgi:ketosteroid isomerase-like protein
MNPAQENSRPAFGDDREQNKRIVCNYVDAFNRGDVDGICLCFGPDALVYGVLGWGDVARVRPIWEQLVTSFGLQLEIKSMLAEGDTVAVRFVERGVFTSSFRGTAPTGRAYEGVAMEWFAFRDGLIHRRWGARDSAAIFRQLGIPLAS